MENASLHYQDHPAHVGGTLDYSGSAAICARLEPNGPLYLACFAGENLGNASRQSGDPMSVHCCEMWPASSGIDQQDLLFIPPLLGGCHGEKWLFIELIDSQHPNTHQPVLFSADRSFNKTRKPIH